MGLLGWMKKTITGKTKQNAERYVGVSTGWDTGGGNLSRDLDPSDMVDAYKSAVYSAVKRIADGVAMTDFHALTKVGSKMEKVIDPNHPFNKLFRDPNPLMDRVEVFERLAVDLDLTGNAYAYIVRDKKGIPVEIHPLMSHRMVVVPERGKDGNNQLVKGYLYTLDGIDPQNPILSAGQQNRATAFTREEVIHLKTANPKSIFYGHSPLEASRYAVDVDQEMAIQRLNLLKNRAIPEGILTSSRPLSPDDVQRVRDQWTQLYKGRGNRGRVAVLDKGQWGFQRLGLNAEELEFQAGKESVWREIFAIYRVPFAILGGPNVNKATVEASERLFITQAVKPRLAKIEATFNKWLMPMFGEGLVFRFADPRAKDSSFRLEEMSKNLALGMTTINEERERNGLEPVSWGDAPWLQMGLGQVGSTERSEVQRAYSDSLLGTLSDDDLMDLLDEFSEEKEGGGSNHPKA